MKLDNVNCEMIDCAHDKMFLFFQGHSLTDLDTLYSNEYILYSKNLSLSTGSESYKKTFLYFLYFLSGKKKVVPRRIY